MDKTFQGRRKKKKKERYDFVQRSGNLGSPWANLHQWNGRTRKENC